MYYNANILCTLQRNRQRRAWLHAQLTLVRNQPKWVEMISLGAFLFWSNCAQFKKIIFILTVDTIWNQEYWFRYHFTLLCHLRSKLRTLLNSMESCLVLNLWPHCKLCWESTTYKGKHFLSLNLNYMFLSAWSSD